MTKAKRILFHVSIIHSVEDMGSLSSDLPAQRGYREHVLGRWAQIERLVRELDLNWPEVKVYQDGLPNSSRDIVEKVLIETQGLNFYLLRWLVAQGAELVGTESPTLLKEEYDHLRAVVTARDDSDKAMARRAYAERASALLSERDAYIAQRIAETLPHGAVGLLFIGQAHRVAWRLPPDIKIRQLSHQTLDK